MRDSKRLVITLTPSVISLGTTLREERKGLNSTRGWAAIFHAPAEALVSPSGFLECSYGNLATEHFALNQFV